LRSDRGGEYLSSDFKRFCEEHGIIHQVTAPYAPQQNGVAERKNRTLMEMVSAMLVGSNLPSNLWGEALFTACHINNRILSKNKTKTPYELWKNRIPNLHYFKVWGCIAYVLDPSKKRNKIGSKAIKAVFIGYAHNSTAYRFLCLKTNSVLEADTAEFLEHLTIKDANSLELEKELQSDLNK
jgi:hypothetical protein